ncbi:MAG: hypothetical protein CUN55_01255 [Phototrophicales bacterium]|nr:MAG: hypothetical protein CUN55_01255 [Phototrophicales bacterium]
MSTSTSTKVVSSRLTGWFFILFALTVIGIWLSYTPDGVQGKADAVGYAICHRIEERSFTTYGDRQLPMCARCSGIYTGVMVGFISIAAVGRLRASRLPTLKVGMVMLLFLIVFGVDGLNSYFHLFPNFEGGLYEPNNTLRVSTGFFVGLSMIHGLLPFWNASVWHPKVLDLRRAVNNLREFAMYIGVAIIVLLLILLNSPFIMLIVGFMSTIGVLLVLTLAMSSMFMNILRLDGSYTHWSQLWLPMLVGLTAAIILIGGIDALRYALTGTWEGFTFVTQAGGT